MRRALFLLGLLLSACSLSLTVVLPDQTLNLPGLGDTGGRVVYPQEGLSFNPPPLDVIRGVKVEGILEASQPLTATLEFYARTEDPGVYCDPLPPRGPFGLPLLHRPGGRGREGGGSGL